jgi:hypothetical protein
MDACIEAGISYKTVISRVTVLGWPEDKALEVPASFSNRITQIDAQNAAVDIP